MDQSLYPFYSLRLTVDFQLCGVRPNAGRVLRLASVFALVTVAYAADDEDRHSRTEISYVDSRLGSADAVSVKTPSDGEGLVARGDDARELSKITLVHYGFRKGEVTNFGWFCNCKVKQI